MSEPVKKELSEAEIAAKTGFGEPAGASEEETTETEEETETTDPTEEEADEPADTEEKEAGDKKPATRQKRGESKSKEDEDDKPGESEDESEEDDTEDEGESDDESNDKGRTVPYSLLKSKNQKIHKLETDLKKALEGRDEAKKSGDEEDVEAAQEEIENSAKKLGEELGMDKDQLAKLLKEAVKLSSKKSALPKDVVEKLKILDSLQNESKQAKEVAHFNKEWDALDIKKQYPNAPKAALKEAQELMDELGHSKEYHQYDLDYILFKNKSKFDSILKTAAKQKSGETGKRVGTEKKIDESTDEEDLVDIEDLTPAIMKQREARELDMRRAHAGEKDYKIYSPQRDE